MPSNARQSFRWQKPQPTPRKLKPSSLPVCSKDRSAELESTPAAPSSAATPFQLTCRVIKESEGIEVDLDNIPIDDELTYKLYQEGRTVGTFQFESVGMQKYLKELHPTVFEDLIAMNALYRPGPMDKIPSFIARKNGREEIAYEIPCME